MKTQPFTEETKQILGRALTVVVLARQAAHPLPIGYHELEALTQDIEFLLCRMLEVEVDISD